MNNRTLLDAWETFELSCSKDASLCQSALFRFTLPGLGGSQPSGARLTSKEIAAALKTLASIDISTDIGEHLREAQKQTFTLLNTPNKRQRQPRYYLNQFINWSIENETFPSAKSPEEKPHYIFYPEKLKRIKLTKREHVYKKFVFSFDVIDYESEPLDPEQIQQHLQRISQECTSFKKYQTSERCRQVTADSYERHLNRILGWLYREKGISLAEISLSKIVPFVRLNFKIREFSSKENRLLSQLIAKAEALENIKHEAEQLVNLLREFFAWLENPPSPKTKKTYIDSLIAYSRYVYRNETDKTMALNFEDIPLINRLKVFQKEVENGKKNNFNPIQRYLLPWPDALEVLEKLRFETEIETIKVGNGTKKRQLSAKAKSLQNFVLLGFFVLVPPSRQRVIRELELGRTLKYGIFENERFTSAEKMANPSEARYYIHLQPEDYKTGDIYGEWLGEFPNTEFPDGSKFYDYLNRWFFRGYQDESGEWHGMREAIAVPGEKTVFVMASAGKAFSNAGMASKIRRIFIRWTELPITPHDLRHSFRSYIEEPDTKATTEEKESAAFWMRHSSTTAKKKYAHLDCGKKLRLGAVLLGRINQQFLSASARTEGQALRCQND